MIYATDHANVDLAELLRGRPIPHKQIDAETSMFAFKKKISQREDYVAVPDKNVNIIPDLPKKLRRLHKDAVPSSCQACELFDTNIKQQEVRGARTKMKRALSAAGLLVGDFSSDEERITF